ncbi:MAG: hypothetical protein ACFFBD_24825 [Candidatus Hodarchaeota archaeon]
MPICSKCGAYYVRPPCPTCDQPERVTRRKFGLLRGSRQEKIVETQPSKSKTPSSVSVIEKIASIQNQLEEKDNQISQLTAKIEEQQTYILQLEKEIKSLKGL